MAKPAPRAETNRRKSIVRRMVILLSPLPRFSIGLLTMPQPRPSGHRRMNRLGTGACQGRALHAELSIEGAETRSPGDPEEKEAQDALEEAASPPLTLPAEQPPSHGEGGAPVRSDCCIRHARHALARQLLSPAFCVAPPSIMVSWA